MHVVGGMARFIKKKNKCGMNTNVSKRDLEYF